MSNRELEKSIQDAILSRLHLPMISEGIPEILSGMIESPPDSSRNELCENVLLSSHIAGLPIGTMTVSAKLHLRTLKSRTAPSASKR